MSNRQDLKISSFFAYAKERGGMTLNFPKGGLIGKVYGLCRRVQQMNIPGHAANAGFFIVLSIFPMLVLVLSVLRYTDLDAQDLMGLLSGYLPSALYDDVQRLLIQTLAYSGAAMVSVSAIGALWSASRGIYAIVRGLNAVFGTQENRGWLYVRGISVFYTFAFLVVLVLGLALHLFGEYLLELLPRQDRLWAVLSGVVDLRFVLLLILQTVLFAAMFTVLPNRPGSLGRSLPGAVLASFGWLLFSKLFSVYVEHFGTYSNIYGSVYAVALGMLWLYCCLLILFYGAAVNRILEDNRKT